MGLLAGATTFRHAGIKLESCDNNDIDLTEWGFKHNCSDKSFHRPIFMGVQFGDGSSAKVPLYLFPACSLATTGPIYLPPNVLDTTSTDAYSTNKVW